MLSKSKFNSQPLFIKAGLSYSNLFDNVRNQSFFVRLSASEILKINGNIYYKKDNIQNAITEYEKALSVFRYIKTKKLQNKSLLDDRDLIYFEDFGEREDDKQLILTLKLTLYLNLSLCYLISQNYINGFQAAQEALILDPLNPKALFRRAKAKLMNPLSKFDDLQTAKIDLELALKIKPDDKVIKEELIKANDELKKKRDFKINQPGDVFHKINDNKENYNIKEDFQVNNKEFYIPRQPIFHELKKNETVLDEIKELEKFLEERGNELVKFYEMAGKFKESQELNERMQKAIVAKLQIEQLSENQDKENENPFLKKELIENHLNNIREIRDYLNGFDCFGESSLLSKKQSINNNNDVYIPPMGNNYFINNNFYSPVNNINQGQSQYINTLTGESLLQMCKTSNKERPNENEDNDNPDDCVQCLNLIIILLVVIFTLLTIIFNIF